MFIFGKIFETVWSGAEGGAKATAAAISTGAKAVGDVPLLAAKAENAIRESYQATANAAQGTIAEAAGGISVTSAQWKAWMDTKVAGASSALGSDINVAQVEKTGQGNVARTQAEQDQKLNSLADRQQQQMQALQKADASRLQAARQLQQKIAASGARAGNSLVSAVQSVQPAVNQLGRQADLLAIKGLVQGAFAAGAIMGAATNIVTAPLRLAKKVFPRLIPGKPVPCPAPPPGPQLANDISKWQTAVDNANKAAASMSPAQAQRLRNSAKQLQNTIDDSERALLAADVYNDPGEAQPAPGYTRVSDADLKNKLHLDPSLFHPQDSGFRAALYKDDKTPPGYVLAFKGTTFSSSEDWENNLAQGVGLDPDYYQRAIRVAIAAKQSTGGNLTVTGHSLGGGLASAAAMSANLKGSTYNSAGLSQDTVPYTDANADKSLTTYQVAGEPLTRVQTSLGGMLPLAAGSPVGLQASADSGLTAKHSMDSVLPGMDALGSPQAQSLTNMTPQAASVGR